MTTVIVARVSRADYDMGEDADRQQGKGKVLLSFEKKIMSHVAKMELNKGCTQ